MATGLWVPLWSGLCLLLPLQDPVALTFCFLKKPSLFLPHDLFTLSFQCLNSSSFLSFKTQFRCFNLREASMTHGMHHILSLCFSSAVTLIIHVFMVWALASPWECPLWGHCFCPVHHSMFDCQNRFSIKCWTKELIGIERQILYDSTYM